MKFPRPRLSVRGLMILTLAIGGVLGWIAHRARVQREAVAIIERSGGGVAYQWQWSNGMPVPGNPGPPGPRWLRRVLGPEFLDRVTYVRLMGDQCGDDAFQAACRLPDIEELVVISTEVTDEAAEDLRHLRNLRSLDFRLNRTTPRPLRHIGGMRELRELKLAMKLSPVPLKDEDMAFLQRLDKLQRLMLPSKDLTDDCLVYVRGLKNLTSLQLYDMDITSSGLDRLKALGNLRELSLHGSRVTSVAPLGPLANLSYLCVAYTPVGDDDLGPIRDWPSLTRLDLRETEVTDEGVAKLMRAHPTLQVTR